MAQSRWSFNSQEVAVQAASIFAFVWYPFAHIYNYHIFRGAISGVPGILRLTTVVAIAILGGLFVFRTARILKRSSAVVVVSFGILIAMFAGWIISHFIFAGGSVGGGRVAFSHSMLLVDYVFLFLVGFYLNPEKGRGIFVLGLIAIVCNTWSFLSLDRFMLDVWDVANEDRTSYLRLSTAALMTGLIVWAGLKRPVWRGVVLVIMIPLLFALVSRAGLGSFLLVLPVALGLTTRLRWQLGVYLFGGGVVAAIVNAVGFDVIAASRHLNLLALDQDTSVAGRSRFLDYGIDQIISSPIFGYYGGTVAELGGIGSYIHNFLSVWQMFGLVPFLMYTMLVFATSVMAVRLFVRYRRMLSRSSQLFVVLGLVSIINVVVAKSYMWSEVAMSWGLLAGLLNRGDWMSEVNNGDKTKY